MKSRMSCADRESYRSGFGFHSRANFCASVICAAVIWDAMKSRFLAVVSRISFAEAGNREAARLSHTCACR